MFTTPTARGVRVNVDGRRDAGASVMLARLFELVCLVEEQIRERDSTIVGIQRVMEDVDEQNRRHWADREAQHRTQMLLVKERYNGPGGAPTSSAKGWAVPAAPADGAAWRPARPVPIRV